MNRSHSQPEEIRKVTIRRCPRCNSKKSYWDSVLRKCYCERCGLQMDDLTIINSKLTSPLEFWYYPKTVDTIDRWMVLWHGLDPSSVPFGVDMLEFQRHFDAYKHPKYKDAIMDPHLNKQIHEEWQRKHGKQKAKNRWDGVYYENAIQHLIDAECSKEGVQLANPRTK